MAKSSSSGRASGQEVGLEEKFAALIGSLLIIWSLPLSLCCNLHWVLRDLFGHLLCQACLPVKCAWYSSMGLRTVLTSIGRQPAAAAALSVRCPAHVAWARCRCYMPAGLHSSRGWPTSQRFAWMFSERHSRIYHTSIWYQQELLRSLSSLFQKLWILKCVI